MCCLADKGSHLLAPSLYPQGHERSVFIAYASDMYVDRAHIQLKKVTYINTYLMKLEASDGLNKDRVGRNSI